MLLLGFLDCFRVSFLGLLFGFLCLFWLFFGSGFAPGLQPLHPGSGCLLVADGDAMHDVIPQIWVLVERHQPLGGGGRAVVAVCLELGDGCLIQFQKALAVAYLAETWG